ncbi:MAG: HAMP domain-containing sensor histidine kinase [Steroidobacteraceae bacterium]
MNIRLTGALSLRRRLAVAALAALLTAVALGTLLLLTAGSAREVAQEARRTHSRVQAYSELISALRTYQANSYTSAQLKTPQAQEQLQVSRSRFLQTLDTVLKLPRDTPQQREMAERIERHGSIVTTHLAHIVEIVERIDTTWRNEGRDAAGAEAERTALPVRELEAILNAEIRRGDEQIEAATNRTLALNHQVLVACIACLLLAVGSWALIHGLLLGRLGPGLRRLQEGTLAFAAGNLGHRVRLGGQDELAQLSSAFDAMAAQLADKQQALQQVQVGLEHAVRERTEQLQRANLELAASDGRRRAFLADIGHELRTPLTIIRGEAQVALRTMQQPDFHPQEAFERIIKHTRDLGRMVDDLFLIARAESGGLPLQIVRTDLRALTEQMAGDFEALALDFDATITATPGPAVYWDLDPDRLRRALSALVDNALRHTRSGVHVEIEARETPRGVALSVSDNGPGVDPLIVPDLFQRFRRGHTHSEGSGLGLSLVRALAEVQGGQSRLENRPHGGARAVLEFTLAR